MTRPRTIGLFTPGWPGQNTPNGIATSVYYLTLGLKQVGLSPVIIAKKTDGEVPDDIPVFSVPERGWRWRDRLQARLGDRDAVHRHLARNIAAAVMKAHRVHGLDAVIIEETNGWAGFLQAMVPMPVIITLHGPWVLHRDMQSVHDTDEDRRREQRENRAFAACAGLISPSRNVLEAIAAHAPVPGRPEIVLPNALASEHMLPPAAATATPDILFVGRFDLHKGGDIVIEAFSRLMDTHPQARLTFVGVDQGVRRPDGSSLRLETVLDGLAAEVRAAISYRGRLDRAQVAALRARHAIALIASRYENLNYTLLEAMAAGQAIVCTAVGGPAEVLENGKTAVLVPPSAPAETAEALRCLLDDPACAARLGQAAQARLAADFSPAAVATDAAGFIEEVLRSVATR